MDNDFELIKGIYNAFDPFRPLKPGDSAYVDCQKVRGDSNIEMQLGKKIVFAEVSDDKDNSTCQLYSGHRGSGKSTELLRLEKYLSDRDCFVVYFIADREDIDPEDAQYTDILLACTRHLLEKLRKTNPDPILNWLKDRWKDLQDLSLTTVTLDKLSIDAAITTFAKVTANLRAVPSQRAKIRSLVDPHTTTLLKALNEFIDEAKNQLPLGKNKLVIIADSLDRIAPTIQENGRTNHDQIFIDRHKQLKGLDCHVIYTVPISLLYSDRANDLYDNYGETQILPMIKVQNQEDDETSYEEGLNKPRSRFF
ncbi:MAG: AAA family ATPase [Prochloraceae cyanobacterium]|nr:AAA family ATPase [Prochloraceae cyanobacterium]